MRTNQDIELRRDQAVAKAIAYSSTFIADKAQNAEVWDVGLLSDQEVILPI